MVVVNFIHFFLSSSRTTYLVQSVSQICAIWNSRSWFSFRLKSIFNTAPAASKNDAQFKGGQNWLKNKQLASLI